MAPTVRDAVLLLTAMAGTDPADPATAEADARRRDYVAALSPDALRGKRIGVARWLAGSQPFTDAVFERALARLREAGAELVEISDPGLPKDLGAREFTVLLHEIKTELNAYLGTTPAAVRTRTLADLIAFNRARAADEMPWFGQDLFEKAEATSGKADPEYVKARDSAKRDAGPDGIDRLMQAHGVAMFVAPSYGPAWMTDLVGGDAYSGQSASQLPAVAGYPHVTVPMGTVKGLPVGLSFFGTAWSEAELLAAAYAFEQRARARVLPSYRKTIDTP
jgi:amidase